MSTDTTEALAGTDTGAGSTSAGLLAAGAVLPEDTADAGPGPSR